MQPLLFPHAMIFFFSFLIFNGEINHSHTNLSIQKMLLYVAIGDRIVYIAQRRPLQGQQSMLGLFGHKPEMIP